jgi:CheY-like chemotaxis protein
MTLAMRILIVDPVPANLAVLDQVLCASGHEPIWADDPRDAIDILPAIDGVLADAATAEQMCRYLRRRRPELPIVFAAGATWDRAELHEAIAYLAARRPASPA